MMYGRSDRRHFVHNEGYQADRDTQWTRNSAAVLRFIGGGEVECHVRGKWVPITALRGELENSMRAFHLYECRPVDVA